MSTAVSALPRCVVLRSKHDNSYLRSVHDENHGGSVIELSGGDGDAGIMDPRCRFYLEPSEEHEGLVHVRCCYNNKYWAPQQRVLHGGSARWVIGTAHEPEEDRSKPSCTVHKLIPFAGEQAEDGSSTYRFLHSKLGKYACTVSSTSIRSYMHIASDEDKADLQDGGLIDAFTVIDVSGQKRLPSYLVFEGDNGRLLQGVISKKHNWLQFQSETNDIGDPRVLHTIFTNRDGDVRIKSNYFDKFWRLSPAWIWADSTETAYNNRDTLFRVTTGDDYIALRNLGNNRFCKRLTQDGFTNCLNAAVGSITNEARIKCYEPVISRDIYDVDFHLKEARTYTTGVDGLQTQIVKNHTSTTSKSTLTFTWKTTVATKWSSTISMKIGIKTTLVTKVPFFAEGKIEVSAEFSGSYTWEETKTEEKQVSKQLTVDVPPMKKVTIKAIGSNGVCDIPFSYKQRDVLINGQEVPVQEFTDGMYVGVKTSNITFETIEEDLSDDED